LRRPPTIRGRNPGVKTRTLRATGSMRLPLPAFADVEFLASEIFPPEDG
jgi:hypothetical protein